MSPVPGRPPPAGGVEAAALLTTHGELVTAVVETVDVGIAVCDADGRLVLLNGAARRFHGVVADPCVPVAEAALRVDLYRGDGSALLTPAELPLYRALTEGRVSDVEVIIAPPGRPAVTARCTGTALHDAAGTVTGAVA